MEVSVDMHVDDNRRVVNDVVMQIGQIFFRVSELADSIIQQFLSSVVQDLALFMHVDHGLVLQVSASVESFALFSLEKDFSVRAGLVVIFGFNFRQLSITKDASSTVHLNGLFLLAFHANIGLFSHVIYDSELFITSWTWNGMS